MTTTPQTRIDNLKAALESDRVKYRLLLASKRMRPLTGKEKIDLQNLELSLDKYDLQIRNLIMEAEHNAKQPVINLIREAYLKARANGFNHGDSLRLIKSAADNQLIADIQKVL